MLSVKNLSKSYSAPVLKNFSYEFPNKGLFLIRGSSGIGKTTLLRLIAGLEKPDSGKVETSGAVLSMVFQEARLLPFLSLKENVLIVKKERDVEKALTLLERFGLEEDAEKKPDQLSGGMRLRGAIVRSLYYGGDIYLWDEPTKELDPENQQKVIDCIHTLAKEALILVVTHDPLLTGGTEIVL